MDYTFAAARVTIKAQISYVFLTLQILCQILRLCYSLNLKYHSQIENIREKLIRKLFSKMWLRRGFLFQKSNIRFLSAQANVAAKFEDLRTSETDPTKHTTNHIGRFYTIDPKLQKSLFHRKTMPKTYLQDAKTFCEISFMIRPPAVEVINYLNNTDFSKPVNRYVFYGGLGNGKSMQLLHLIHYGYVNNFIIVHVPWVPDWFKKPREKSNSFTKEGFIDINIDAAAWLIHFKIQNAELLQKLDLKCSKEYVWSQRETTPAGSTLLELVEHGVNRVKYASDALAVLIEELKNQSTEGKCRTMVAIDGFNAFFHTKTYIKGDNKVLVAPEKITITDPFLSLAKADWCNGVCLFVVDKWALTADRMDSDLPKYLLRRKGFEYLDPFIPMHVDTYNDVEFQSMFNYYLDRKWILNYEPGMEKQLKFLSNGNGYELKEMSAPL